MRRLIASAIVSSDGYCEGPRGELVRPPWSRALGDESLATLDRCDALLYGRVGFLRDRAFWHRPDAAELPMARLLARYPKLVCSTTLPDDVGWNARVLRASAGAQLAAIKQQPGKDLVVFGSPTLLSRLAGHDLIDEIRMLVSPHALGAGTPWPTAPGLALVETRELDGGLVLRCYRRQERA